MDPGLETAVLKFHEFSGFFMTVRNLNVTESCAGRVWLSILDKNIGVCGWRVDNLCEAVDSDSDWHNTE